MCARPWAAVSPNQPARASAFHSGAIAPASAGTHEHAVGTRRRRRRARPFSSSYTSAPVAAARAASTDPSSSRNQR